MAKIIVGTAGIIIVFAAAGFVLLTNELGRFIRDVCPYDQEGDDEYGD
ncbi:MAG: hypothetical protein Q4C77_03955 [Eubacteriales bacterium]|nr:hypothetical protein [Eubacteriales bacterium]